MRFKEELSYDMDFGRPRVITDERFATIENVKAIVMISETSLTVSAGKNFVTLTGSDFVIKEIFEGRLLIEGTIQRVEFFRTSDKDKD